MSHRLGNIDRALTQVSSQELFVAHITHPHTHSQSNTHTHTLPVQHTHTHTHPVQHTHSLRTNICTFSNGHFCAIKQPGLYLPIKLYFTLASHEIPCVIEACHICNPSRLTMCMQFSVLNYVTTR